MNEQVNKGIGLPGMIFLVFLTLKLLGEIDWSWWWITAPLWGSFVIAFVFIIGIVVIDVIKNYK